MIETRVLIAACVLQLGCGGGHVEPPADPFACIEGWPAAADVPATAPLGVAPGVLWTQLLGEHEWPPLGQKQPMTVSGAQIIMALNQGMAVLDRTTGQRVAWPAPPATHSGTVSYLQPAPAADAAGNLYGVAQSAYSLDPTGATRWQVYIGATVVDPGGEFHNVYRSPVVLSPDGLVFVRGAEGLQALRAADGSQLFRIADGAAFAGAGPVIISEWEVRDASDGSLRGDVRSSAGTRLHISALAGFGFVGWHGDPEIVEAVDACDNVIWSLPAGASSFLNVNGVGPDGVTYLSRRPRVSAGGPNTLMTVSALGKIRSTTTTEAGLVAIGADGTAYLEDCSQQPAEIVALGPELEPLWRLAIDGECPSDALLADDGVLFLLNSVGARYQLVAVQTTSPGLARTGWTLWTHDARATHWLLP